MDEFDQKLKNLLSEEDENFITDAIDETGYYRSVLQSFKGQGSGMNILAWIGVAVTCALLFFCIWNFFHAETTRDQILFATLALSMNSAQIALKLWYNMQLNRRTITREIKRLQLTVAKAVQDK